MPFIHATAIVLRETGVLLRGASGSGKSALALALLEQEWRQGHFAALIGDDRVDVACFGHRLLATSHPSISGQIERRGYGIETMQSEKQCVIGLVVDLLAAGIEPARLPEISALETSIETVLLQRTIVSQAEAMPICIANILGRLALL